MIKDKRFFFPILVIFLFLSVKCYSKLDASYFYNKGFEDGKKFCRNYPDKCGIGENYSNIKIANRFASSECGIYNASNSKLYIPCVEISGNKYWLDLSLQKIINDNVTFTLNNFGANSEPLTIKILHVNDTQSHLVPMTMKVKIDKDNYTYVYAGGYSRIANYVKEVKESFKNTLFLHAGDAVQGTLYYTEFKGEADVKAMNLMNIDAFVPGNHEFDNGADIFASKFVYYATFPIICADINFSKIPTLSDKIRPYIIKDFSGEKIAIVGIDTDATENISNPGPDVDFYNYVQIAKNSVNLLKSHGINKIIFLTHLGYNVDKELAKQVEDIDIIVGGHSHTPLGNLEKIGLTSDGPYPTVVENNNKPVLIVTAWKWGLLVGNLNVSFDSKGVIIKDSWKNSFPVMLIGDKFIEKNADGEKVEVSNERKEQLLNLISSNNLIKVENEDINIKNEISKFTPEIENLKNQVIGSVSENLIHVRLPGDKDVDSGEVLKYGSMVAPLVAESMLEKAQKNGGAEIAIQNAGGVRKSLKKGNLTVGDVYELLPFGNTIVVMDITGAELKNTLENAIDRSYITHESTGSFPYLAGARMFLDFSKPKGERIVKFQIKQGDSWQDILPDKTYRLVTHSYLANGGDYYKEFKELKGVKEDLGFIDADVFMEFVKKRGTLTPESVDESSIRFANELPND